MSKKEWISGIIHVASTTLIASSVLPIARCWKGLCIASFMSCQFLIYKMRNRRMQVENAAPSGALKMFHHYWSHVPSVSRSTEKGKSDRNSIISSEMECCELHCFCPIGQHPSIRRQSIRGG